jgi:hypothetical protein
MECAGGGHDGIGIGGHDKTTTGYRWKKSTWNVIKCSIFRAMWIGWSYSSIFVGNVNRNGETWIEVGLVGRSVGKWSELGDYWLGIGGRECKRARIVRFWIETAGFIEENHGKVAKLKGTALVI